MQRPYHYLRTSLRDLAWGYGLIYSALLIVLIFSYYPIISILTVSVWYWVIVGILFVLEYYGSYMLIEGENLVVVGAFRRGTPIPYKNIHLLGVGRSTVVILQPAGILFVYTDAKGREQKLVRTFHTFDPQEVAKFVHDIAKAEPNIKIDHALHDWIEKNTTKK